jgi:hypothetical protein
MVGNGEPLIALYVGFFIAAEAAFAIMALREYLQDLLGLLDMSLITSNSAAKTER